MFELTCSIQNYEWGKLGTDSKVAVLYKNANPDYVIEDGTPYAELWMGTHINGPSRLKSGDTLSNVIHDTPARLGRKVLDKFGSELPFLFKVLSIHKALSIQVHPSKRHAERLHADRPDLYKDPNHKPELAIALTPFEALCGFRPISQIKNFFKVVPELKGVIGEKIVDDFVRCDEVDSEKYLRKCFEALMTCSPETVTSQLKKALERFANLGVQERIEQCSTLIERLHEQFPNDVGCFVVYFLNVIELQPNEAIYLGANEPHAYLSGDCVECMACSDNVVRAGLTPKYKDVATLCSMLNYEGRPAGAKLFKPVVENDSSQVFRPPVPDFAVVKIEVHESNDYKLIVRDSASILLVVKGSAMSDGLQLISGSVIFIPADLDVNLCNITEGFLAFQAMANV